MRNRILIPVMLSGVVWLTGCAAPTPKPNVGQQSLQSEESNTLEQVTDGKMDDTSIIEHDPELYVGDLGVKRGKSPARIRGFEANDAKAAPLLDPDGYPLIRRYPDKAILPVRGSYAENVIETAKSFLGTPYVWGSDRTEPSSFDCSDFTRWVYLSALGMDLPWNSRSQAAYVQAFSKRTFTRLEQARRGDLLFFTGFRGNRAADYEGLSAEEKPISHMGIYLGNGKIIHSASKKTGGVRIDTIRGKHLEYRLVLGAGILD